MCGFHWNKHPATAKRASSAAACTGSPYSSGGALDPEDDNSKDQYVVLVFQVFHDVTPVADGAGAPGGRR